MIIEITYDKENVNEITQKHNMKTFVISYSPIVVKNDSRIIEGYSKSNVYLNVLLLDNYTEIIYPIECVKNIEFIDSYSFSDLVNKLCDITGVQYQKMKNIVLDILQVYGVDKDFFESEDFNWISKEVYESLERKFKNLKNKGE